MACVVAALRPNNYLEYVSDRVRSAPGREDHSHLNSNILDRKPDRQTRSYLSYCITTLTRCLRQLPGGSKIARHQNRPSIAGQMVRIGYDLACITPFGSCALASYAWRSDI